jgi:uncharacterized protein
MTTGKEQLYDQLRAYLQAKGVRRAAVFGSFARDEETPDSDIDILIEIDGVTLFDFINMEFELEAMAHRKIDLVDYRAVKPLLKKYIFAHTIPLI